MGSTTWPDHMTSTSAMTSKMTSARKTLMYDQLEIDSPTRALSEVLRNREMFADDNVTATAAAATAAADATSIAKSILTASEAPWASFFTGGLTAAKLEKVNNNNGGEVSHNRSQAKAAAKEKHGGSRRQLEM